MTNITYNTEKELLRDLMSGKYADTYLAYGRQSTDEEKKQKYSISHQVLENTKFAQRENLMIANITFKGFCKNGMVNEKDSAYKESDFIDIKSNGEVEFTMHRKKWSRALAYLSKGYFKGLICLCWDRASRNDFDSATIKKLSKKVDFRFAYAKYDDSAAGKLHMSVDGMFSNYHSLVTSEKVLKAKEKFRKQGLCTYRAPFGYLNKGRMEFKPIDKVRGPFVTDIFEKYATGTWTYSDLADYGNEQGITMPPGRRRRTREERDDVEFDVKSIPKICRPLTKSSISYILNQPFYTGRIKGNDGVYIKSNSHEALVSDALFNKVQDMMKKRSVVSIRSKKKLEMPFRGIIRCQECNRTYTPYLKKGNYYFASKCKPDCKNKTPNISFNFLDQKIKKEILVMSFSDGELSQVNKKAFIEVAQLEAEREAEIASAHNRKKKLVGELAYMDEEQLTLLKTGVYTPESLMSKKRKISSELIKIDKRLEKNEQTASESLMDAVKLSELIKNVGIIYDSVDIHQKEQISRTLFTELFVSDNTLAYKANSGFEALKLVSVGLCGSNTTLPEFYADYFLLKETIKTLEMLIEMLDEK